MLASTTLCISIDRPPADVYAFVSNPENLPRWAAGLCRSVRNSNGTWIVETPAGPMTIRFAPPNALGVLDHVVSPAPGQDILVPMRVIPNAAGSELLFTVFRLPGMSDEKLAEDVGMVQRDLDTLKRILEQTS